MTTKEIDYKCPLCQAENRTVLTIAVDSEDKESVQQLVQGSLFEKTCRGCAEPTSFDYSFRFTNHRLKLCFWNTPANDPFKAEFEQDDSRFSDYSLRRTVDMNAMRELLMVQLAGLDDGAMLVLKHMLAYKVREDTGVAPLLCGFDAIYADQGQHWLEYIIFKDEESEADALHIPIQVYDDISSSVQPLKEEFLPKGMWVDWTEMTAAQMWQRLTEKAGIQI